MKTDTKVPGNEWQTARIEEVFAPLEDGRTLHQGWSPQCEKEPSESEDEWGVLKTTSIQPLQFCPEHNKALPKTLEPRPLLEVRAGDILITCAGPRVRCGISCMVEETRKRLMISGKMYRFRPRPAVMSSRFLAAFLQTEQAETAIDGMKTGGSESGLNLTHARFRQLLIPVPPLPEQQRIVGVLDEAFAALATAQAHAAQNVQNARALFESHLQSVFTHRGKGWVETTLGEAYDVRDGTHDSPKYHATGYPLITSKNLKPDGLSFDDVKLINEADYNKINERSAVHRGDVLFAMIGTIGNPTIVAVEPRFAIKNVALFKVPNGKSSRFLKHYLDSEQVKSKMAKEAKGTTQKFVGLGYLRSFPILLPPLETQNEIVEELDALAAETQRLTRLYEQKQAALDELKKSLLHQAFTGQL